METLSGDVLRKIMLEFDLPDIIPLCKTSKRFNQSVCDNQIFWMNKVKRDYSEQFRVIFDRKIPVNWKNLYMKIYSVETGKAKFRKIRRSIPLNSYIMSSQDQKWANPSGLLPSIMAGWVLKRDKNNSSVVYFYPGTYYQIFGPVVPKQGENHPNIMLKISFPEATIEEIPWDESLLGETLFYRRGDGKVSWFNETYDFKIEFDGGSRYTVFTVYSIEY